DVGVHRPPRAHVHPRRSHDHRDVWRRSWRPPHVPDREGLREHAHGLLPLERSLPGDGRAGIDRCRPVRAGGGGGSGISGGKDAHRVRLEDGRMKIPFSYIWRSLWARRLTTTMTISGVALVVFVF